MICANCKKPESEHHVKTQGCPTAYAGSGGFSSFSYSVTFKEQQVRGLGSLVGGHVGQGEVEDGRREGRH